MKPFEVYFEIYGKKMKATVHAESAIEAKKKILSKVKFNKIVPKPPSVSPDKSVVDNIFEMLGVKQTI